MIYCCFCKTKFSSSPLLSIHLGLIPEPAHSYQLLNPQKGQKGILFGQDSACGKHPTDIPVERQGRKCQMVSILLTNAVGLILDPSDLC